MNVREVKIEEANKIEELFQATYNRKQGIDYWKWCFKNPYGYINSGMFNGEQLVGYYAAHLTKDSACIVSAKTHPNFRKQGIFMKLSQDLFSKIPRDYVFLFSNDMIRSIHIESEGFIETHQIKEYRVPFNIDLVNDKFWFCFPYIDDPYLLWRYEQHPLYKYFIWYRDTIYSLYGNRVQIIEYEDLEKALGIGMYIAKALHKDIVSFWSEKELDYPYVMIPTWKQFKMLNKEVKIEDILKNDKTRMGQSDIF